MAIPIYHLTVFKHSRHPFYLVKCNLITFTSCNLVIRRSYFLRQALTILLLAHSHLTPSFNGYLRGGAETEIRTQNPTFVERQISNLLAYLLAYLCIKYYNLSKLPQLLTLSSPIKILQSFHKLKLPHHLSKSNLELTRQ